MSPVADDLANILSAVVTQIRTLSDDEVKALVAGEAEFRLVPRRPSPPSTAPASARKPAASAARGVDPAEVRAELDRCASEPDALNFLQDLRLNVAAAKALATGLGLRLPARPSVGAINAEIVRVLVRGRLNAATVQRL
jgi:hypothetical protein